MKKFRRIAALLMAVVVVLAMTIPAFAANNGTITITNAPKDNEYKIYRIFDLESYSGTNYSYKINTKWTAFANSNDTKAYITVDNGYVEWVNGADKDDFADLALQYANDNAIADDSTFTTTTDNETVSFTGLTLGYYLVDSNLGSICALTTTNPTADIVEKNSTASLEKAVKGGNSWGSSNDADFGDTVEFKATIKVQGKAYNYVVNDTMGDGLDFSQVTRVTKNGTQVATANYTVNSTTHSFTLTFTKAFCDGLVSGDEIVVYYKATLNTSAVVKGAGNDNSAYLSYTDQNNSASSTTPSATKTYTYQLPVYKYANDDKATPLANAEFVLYADANCTTAINVQKISDTEYKVNPASANTKLTTPATGLFTVKGLDEGTYYLKETNAPEGYNELNTVVTVTIADGGVVKQDNTSVERIEINNNSGAILPTTGGVGTKIFYLIGGVILIGVIVAFVTKRRMSVSE